MLLRERGPSLAAVVLLKLPVAIGAQSNSSDNAGGMECCLDGVDRLLYTEMRAMLLCG